MREWAERRSLHGGVDEIPLPAELAWYPGYVEWLETQPLSGMTPQEAIAHLRAHRNLCGPEAGAQTELLAWLFRTHAGQDVIDVE